MGSGLKLPLVAGVVIVASLAMLATVQSSPPTPHLFYGSVLIDGEDAQIGTVISAEVSGVPQGTTTVNVAGQYGGPAAEDDKLIVSDPGTVLFYVGGVLANETTTFSSGAITQFNLTAEAGVQTVHIPLQQGFNLIALPVDPGPLTSRELLDQINAQGGTPCSNATAFLRCAIQAIEWNATAQAFGFNFVDSESGKFNVFPGKGFFLNVPTVPPSGGWDVTGSPIAAPVDLTLLQGFNLVSVPVATPVGGYNSREFLDAINTQGGTPCANATPFLRCAIQAIEWNATTQAFGFNFVDSESGKFDIDAIKGFFINVNAVPSSPFVP